MRSPRTFSLVSAVALLVVAASAIAEDGDPVRDDLNRVQTATPIKHLVVIFQENTSFDHYFGTYPKAQNLAGETPFTAKKNTPAVNNLVTPLDVNNHFVPLTGVDLVSNNPNSNPAAPGNGKQNGSGASNPFRLAPSQALTAGQGRDGNPAESAYDNGKMDGFPAWAGAAAPPPAGAAASKLVMGYFDGNTTTAIWNYAQNFALNDNNYATQFGPSTPAAINLISGQSNGLAATLNVLDGSGNLLHPAHEAFGDAAHVPSNLTEIGDGDPLLDVCSNPNGDQVTLAGRNIGDLLNAKGVTWGSFMGGFDLGMVNANGTTGCTRETDPTAAGTPQPASTDYIPHYAWFQYYASTRNPTHARPSSVEAIGHSLIPHTGTPDPANHNYDIHDFLDALKSHNLPAVSFLKAPAFEDGHAGYSDPLDEQHFLVQVINTLQKSPEWADTAVVILYGGSNGWYDHQMPPVVNASFSPTVDTLNAQALCQTSNGSQQGYPPPAPLLNGNFGQPAWGRCGYGTRAPLLVISPFARRNYVDHTLTDQSSVLRFIEDNWLQGERIQPGGSFDTIAGSLEHMFDFDDRDQAPRKLILDEITGAVLWSSDGGDHDRH
ncbi:alkaline phosphatase family protein [Bradyrhizobium sp.]|uniref:alkaline phosphatase family protein n=1 Tax=Bradyrhizobium sp. TaxID=376 RepID=UPI003C566260